jgi:tetratricopeptide (TPR) repeat protein
MSRLRPRDANMHISAGRLLLDMGMPAEATEMLYTAVKNAPASARARGEYAAALEASGRSSEAAEQYARMSELLGHGGGAPKVDSVEIHRRLGLDLAAEGELEKALAQFDLVLERSPGDTSALANSAAVLGRLNRLPEAAARYSELLRRQPDNARAARELAHCLRLLGRDSEAAAVLRDAALRTEEPDLLCDLADLLATSSDGEMRNGAQAVQLAERALKQAGRPSPRLMNTLAAAYAETGRYPEAVAISEEVLRRARAAGQEDAASDIERRLRLYRQGQPYRRQP